MRAMLLSALLLGTAAVPALAQDDKVVVDEDTQKTVDDILGDAVDEGCKGKCCPPSTSDKVIMGVSSAVLFLVLFFLMVRLMERVFIRREASPLLGRHLGISVALFLGGAGMMGIFFLVTGCMFLQYYYFLGFVGAVWLLHLIYTLLAVRR
jgi:hypothetical protein